MILPWLPPRFATGLIALILLVSPFQSLPASSVQAQAAGLLERLQHWVEAVESHAPGKADSSATEVGSWTRSELVTLFPYISSFFDALSVEPRRSRPGVSQADIDVIQALARGSSASPAPAGFVKRAAGLHADIAMLGIPSRVPEFLPPSRQPQSSQFPVRSFVMETDGQRGAVGTGHAHWDMARAVLTFTLPDEDVQLWYRATTAHMMQNGELAYVMPHSAAAVKLFPSSATTQFAAGCLHERLASSRIQRVAERDQGLTAGVGSQSTNTTLAERFFRRALSVDPTFAEASVRLGRLLAERGERSTALTHLRITADSSVSRVVSYYRALFLGELEADLGNSIAAAAAYREAQDLFPRAQSPRLALGLLAISAGLQPDPNLLAPLRSRQRSPDEDPWWVYTWCEGRDADGLSTALRATINRGTR